MEKVDAAELPDRVGEVVVDWVRLILAGVLSKPVRLLGEDPGVEIGLGDLRPQRQFIAARQVADRASLWHSSRP